MTSYTTSAGKHFADFAICDDECAPASSASKPRQDRPSLFTGAPPNGTFRPFASWTNQGRSREEEQKNLLRLCTLENAQLKARVAELEKANKAIWANYDYRCAQLHDIEAKLSGLINRWDEDDEEAKDNYDNDETILLTPNKTRKDELKDAVFTSAL